MDTLDQLFGPAVLLKTLTGAMYYRFCLMTYQYCCKTCLFISFNTYGSCMMGHHTFSPRCQTAHETDLRWPVDWAWRTSQLALQDVLTFFFPMIRQPLGGLGRLIFRGFTITHIRHTTVGRTPLDEWQARRRDLYLTTHNTHKRQTSMPPVGFEPTILVSERPQTHACHWDRLSWL
jgi:hypothetical protein